MLPLLIELHYLPCIQYFAKLISYDEVWLEQQEHYNKGSYRNRCYIAGANSVQLLSIPLAKGKNEQQAIRETRIAYDTLWQKQHWRTIRSAYGNSPYFDFYAADLERFYQKQYDFLFDFNYDLLSWLTTKLQMDIDFRLTEVYQSHPATDFIDWRNGILPKSQQQQTDVNFKVVYYPQTFEERHGFLSNLSILDLLFCAGPGAVMVLEESVVKSPK